MNILLLAPQPFYSERGTPIAVRNLATVLGNAGHNITMYAFVGGQDVPLKNTTVIRVGSSLKLRREIAIGFSITKLILDVFLLFQVIGHCFKNRYDVIHAVEESVYIAIIASKLCGAKVVYDMDSSMVDQLVERWSWLSKLQKPFDFFESLALRGSDHVIAVCQALAQKAEKSGSKTPVTILEDISNNQVGDDSGVVDNLAEILPEHPKKLLYIGNLEHYQGVGLVLEAMAEKKFPEQLCFIVIGGLEQDIHHYQLQAASLGIADRVKFLGPRPVRHLARYLKQADILVSPRLKGANTPMKIYTYLGAGKPTIATRIASHTQVLNDNNACLVAPEAAALAEGAQQLCQQPEKAQAIAAQALDDATNRFSFERFQQKLLSIYATL